MTKLFAFIPNHYSATSLIKKKYGLKLECQADLNVGWVTPIKLFRFDVKLEDVYLIFLKADHLY